LRYKLSTGAGSRASASGRERAREAISRSNRVPRRMRARSEEEGPLSASDSRLERARGSPERPKACVYVGGERAREAIASGRKRAREAFSRSNRVPGRMRARSEEEGPLSASDSRLERARGSPERPRACVYVGADARGKPIASGRERAREAFLPKQPRAGSNARAERGGRASLSERLTTRASTRITRAPKSVRVCWG